MTRAVVCTVAIGCWFAPAVARAQVAGDELAAARSQVGWGASVSPDRAVVTGDGGWNGGDRHAEADATVETVVVGHASVFAGVQYGAGEPTSTSTRPTIGIAYQLTDPRRAVIGVRVSGAYKPDGFSEPGGELESVVVATHLVGRDAARALVAYGRDPEGAESDVEAGASYLHRAADPLVLGATSRVRSALARKPGEPRWDLIAGAVAELVLSGCRVELLVGADTVASTATTTGVIGLVGLGIDL